jgi:phenylalanyl-tRNA synthetase beta chain
LLNFSQGKIKNPPNPLTKNTLFDKKIQKEILVIPFWRKDLHYKADIAEEIARISGYNEIKSTLPQLETGAVIQSNIRKLKNDARDFFVNNGYFEMYNYSFVNEELMQKFDDSTNYDDSTSYLVPIKNPLSEELTHLR